MPHVLKCPGCDARVTHTGGGTLMAIGREHDRLPVMTVEGEVFYLCIPCAQRAADAARVLAEIVGPGVMVSNLHSRWPVPGDPFNLEKPA